MSDFDAVLERLLTDPSFAAALAADPDSILSGYTLADGEADLLRQQVAGDTAAGSAVVESRITKSSTFGLMSPFAGAGGLAGMLGNRLADCGPAAPAAPLGAWSEFGSAAGGAAQQAAQAVPDPVSAQGIGPATDAWGAGGGTAAARSGLGDVPERDLDGLPAASRLGGAPNSALGEAPPAAEPEEREAPKGYRNRVDADGDGDWDRATYRGGKDGGAEILVDVNGDGGTDFIGYDTDADNRVDYADYDKDNDGIFEKRMYDDTGDGLLDRTKYFGS
jgi:hypothetical protein